MKRVRWLGVALGWVAIGTVSSSIALGQVAYENAAAQQGTDPSALAEATFEQARVALREGRTERACSLLEASARLEPALGTSLLLAHCYEQLGRTASAWALFREVAARAAKQDDGKREEIARVRAAALTGRLSKLSLQVNGIEHRATRVSLDGIVIPAESWDIEIPVDPGTRTVRAEAPGHEPWVQQIEVGPGASLTRLHVPELTPRARSSTRMTPRAASSGNVVQPTPANEPASTSRWAYVLGAAGGLGLAAGATFAVLAQRDYDVSLERCRTETLCSSEGLALRSRAERRATWATVGTATGLGFTAAALVMFLGRETGTEELPQVAWDVKPGAASLHWGGTF